MKVYHTAPLPFMGQKKRFLKKVKEVINEHPDNAVYVDLFGGSGLLSHTVKQAKPSARVVYNDFDDYRKRLANIEKTNALLADIGHIVADTPKHQKVPTEARKMILERVQREEQEHGYVDYITLSSTLCFSMKYVLNFEELSKETFYARPKRGQYDATGYLEGVIVECMDYKALFNKYRHYANVVWLVDPPYLSTETKQVSNH